VGRQQAVVLTLIGVDEDGMATLWRDSRTSEGGLPQLTQDEGAEQAGGFGSEQTLGQVDQQHLALGEDLAQMEAWCGLAEYRPDSRSQQKGPQLVHDRGQHGSSFGVRQSVEPGPEGPEGDVLLPAADQSPAETWVGVKGRQMTERGIRPT